MKDFKIELGECKTMGEIFNTVNKYYDTTQKLPYITCLLVTSNVKKILKELQIPLRNG